MTPKQLLQAQGYEFIEMEEVAEWRTRPGFDAAVRTSVRNGVRDALERPYSPMRNIREFMGAIFVFYLHNRPGGLTLATLRDLCSAAGAPRAMAIALLTYLRFLHYVEPLPRQRDRRLRAFAPTAEMTKAAEMRLRNEMNLAATIDGDVARLLEHFHEPEVFAAFMDAFAVNFLEGHRLNKFHGQPLDIFAHRSGGFAVLQAMLSSGPEGDEPIPPRGPMTFRAGDLARVAGTSRQHVMRMLREAEAQGLITRPSPRQALATPLLHNAIGDMYGAIFGVYAACGRVALRRAGYAEPVEIRGAA